MPNDKTIEEKVLAAARVLLADMRLTKDEVWKLAEEKYILAPDMNAMDTAVLMGMRRRWAYGFLTAQDK